MKQITSIKITGSSFYVDTDLSFSSKLNCIMGGRGTGKTTLLYFLKAGLEIDAENNKTVYSILKDNLKEGKIIVTYQNDDGQQYNVAKTFNDPPQISLNGRHVSSEKFETDIICDFYEAQAIEEIGRNGYSRLQLLDKKIHNEVQEYLNKIKEIQNEARFNAQEIKSLNTRILQKREILSDFANAENQLQEVKSQKPEHFSEANNIEFEIADKKEKIRLTETRYVTRILTEVLDSEKGLTKFIMGSEEFLSKYVNPILSTTDLNVVNKTEITSIAVTTANAINKSISFLQQAIEVLQTSNIDIAKTSSELSKLHEVQQSEFVKFKQGFENSKEYINRYNSLSKRVEESKHHQQELDDFIERRSRIKIERIDIISRFNQMKQELFNRRLKCAKEINSTFDKSILISLSYGGLKDEFEEKLRNALKGSGLRYNELIPRIVQNFSPDQFASIVHNNDLESLKTIAGIDETRSTSIVNSLVETDYIYEIESIYTPDLPDFLLRIRKSTELSTENYKKSDVLSMGQRCTAVLPVIFSVSDNPLIIDQPEDNLDNKYISESIHEIIRIQKKHRQLIFITHNPNIPVLSEAEKNIFLTFDIKSEVETQGSVEEVKEQIVNLLEGGEKAFKLRKETYGY